MSNMAQVLTVTLVELGKCCLLSIYLHLPIFFFFPILLSWFQFAVKTPLPFKKIPLTFEIKKKEFSSVAQSCPTLCNSMDCSTPGLPVHYQLQEACPLMKSLGTSSYLTALASQRMWANTQVDHTTQPSSLQETGVKRPSGVSDK